MATYSMSRGLCPFDSLVSSPFALEREDAIDAFLVGFLVVASALDAMTSSFALERDEATDAFLESFPFVAFTSGDCELWCEHHAD